MRVRTLEEKDLKEIPRVFEEVYRNYSLYTEETYELYRNFVDKDREMIFVVEDKNTLLGYVVMGIRDIGSSVMISVYEMVATDREGYDMLMGKVEEIGREKGAALIDTVAPVKSDVTAYLISTGFQESRTIASMAHLCDKRRVFTLFVEKAVTRKRFGKDVTVLFCTDQERIRVKLPEGEVDSGGKADIKVVLPFKDLLSLLLKRSDCLSLVLKRRMKVKPAYRVLSVCKVVAYLAEDVKMVTPFVELV